MHLKVQGKIAKRRQVPDKFQDKACRAKQAPRTLTLSCCPSNGTELHSNRCCSCSTLTWRRDEGEDGRVGGGGDSKTSETKHRSSPALLLKKTITGSMQYNRTARNRSTLRHSLMLCQVFALAPMGGIHVAGGAGSVEPGPPEAVSPSACARKKLSSQQTQRQPRLAVARLCCSSGVFTASKQATWPTIFELGELHS